MPGCKKFDSDWKRYNRDLIRKVQEYQDGNGEGGSRFMKGNDRKRTFFAIIHSDSGITFLFLIRCL